MVNLQKASYMHKNQHGGEQTVPNHVFGRLNSQTIKYLAIYTISVIKNSNIKIAQWDIIFPNSNDKNNWEKPLGKTNYSDK